MSWQQMTDEVMRVCTETFTSTVLYDPQASAPITIKGIFDAAYQDVEILDGAAVQTIKPRLGVRLSDLPAAPREGDRCTINGKNYRVAEVRPDGEAGAALFLHTI